jgi:putative ABC transport system substrate-binding protein
MKRRDFITLLGGAIASWPLTARAQQSAKPVIGSLSIRANGDDPQLLAAFRKGLIETGFVEGQNVAIEFRWASGQDARLPALAADLVARKVSIIVAASGVSSAQAAKAATTSIPIVFVTGVDPVVLGLVSNLNRPGGNLTGVSNLNAELVPKRLELLHEVLPTARLLALLVNPNNPNSESLTRASHEAAGRLGLELHVVHASTDREFDALLTTVKELRVGGIVIGTDAFLISRSTQLAALTARHGIPAIFQYHEFVKSGGLMSYGGSDTDTHRLLGVYAGRILKGEKPGDLPIQQSTPQNREGARTDRSALTARPRRRGD